MSKNYDSKIKDEEKDFQKGKSTNTRGGRNGNSRNSQRISSRSNSKRNNAKIASTSNSSIPKRNDATWWNKFGNLNEVACNLTWNVMQGAPRVRDFGADISQGTPPTMATATLPTDVGINIIETIPNLGACRHIGDPINKAMIEIYNMVRWNKNANVPYDAADIGKLLWAYDSFVSLLAVMRRFYALTNAVDPRNRYVSRAMIYAMGADPDDMYTNRANLVFAINQLSIQAAKINIPAEFKVFDRHELLYDNVFVDSTVARASYYIFMPRCLCKYNDQTLNLDYINFMNCKFDDDHSAKDLPNVPDTLISGTPRITVAALVQMANRLLDAIQTSSDFYMLNANIYGAYSERGLHPVKVIDSFYTIAPLYREEILSQIHNAEFATIDASNISVVENATLGSPDLGALEFCPSVEAESGIALGYNKYVDVPWESPSIDDVLEATRLKMTAAWDPASVVSTTNWFIDSCGTEICIDMCTWYFTYTAGAWKLEWYMSRGWTVNSVEVFPPATAIKWLEMESSIMTKVDRYPLTTVFGFLYDANGFLTNAFPDFVLGDMDNYAMIDVNQLHNIHTAALLSVLLNGPTVGSSPIQETK